MATSAFGKSVKIRLIEIERSQEWLIEQVKEKTGLFFDSFYLWRILSGASTNPKIMAAIREILDLPTG